MFGCYDLASLRQFWREIAYAPDGKRGVYAKRTQKKRRKLRRRTGKGW